MKKLKYILIIVIACVGAIVGFKLGKMTKHKVKENSTTNDIIINEEQENKQENLEGENKDDSKTEEQSNVENEETEIYEEPKELTKEEIISSADKELSPRGWAGASNNVILLKNKSIYYYNKSSEEFYLLATDVIDIYFEEDFSEEITAKKGENFKENKEKPEFVIYK